MKRYQLILSLSAVLLLAFASCKKTDPKQPMIKVIHAVPNVPDALSSLPSAQRVTNVNVFAFTAGSVTDSVTVTSILPYPRVSNYETIKQGSFDLRVRPRFLNANVISANGVSFSNDAAYTIIAYDSVNKIKAMILNDDLKAPGNGSAKIRFLHLSPNAPSVDIINLQGNQPIFSGRTFADNIGNEAKASFTEVPSGTYNLDVRLAGTTTSVLTVNTLILESGKIYTIWAAGIVGGSATAGRQLQVLVDQNK
jgi:hypothetical protein